ncbi:hypothetical protein ACFQ48_02725 [Hymenobacter caeli]|uniref:DUF2589 domain-containing protein n=1 Tax=Hymenobacter caeli TaxID=2735894 RepID=A0ABX2FLB0_9BACT|nr:hypothetical protein [Hymenobacter caeli]NRT17737.1 hypothetical protein [Hymenobacter caeli]
MANATPGLLTPDEFDRYTKQWLAAAADAKALAACFAAPGGKMPNVQFTLQQVVQLVSTVGGRFVKARFLVTDDHKFSVALFVTDAADQQLSAYYVPLAAANAGDAAQEVVAARTAASPAQVAVHATQVPHNLVREWLLNWAKAGPATPAMFTTPAGAAAGPLRGYNFDLSDFMTPLYNAQPFDQQNVCLNFTLHEFYAPVSAALTQTFGLAMRLYNPTEKGAATSNIAAKDTTAESAATASDDPFFDIGQPSPPAPK